MAYKKREDLLKDIEILENYIVFLEEENEKLKKKISDFETLKNVPKVKNERNAGRKRKFNREDIAIIDEMYLRGESMRSIAKYMKCSVGLIHKIINEPDRGRDD